VVNFSSTIFFPGFVDQWEINSVEENYFLVALGLEVTKCAKHSFIVAPETVAYPAQTFRWAKNLGRTKMFDFRRITLL